MTRDYSLLIGKKFGDREILNIIQRSDSWRRGTYAVCKCKCGSVDEVPLTQLKTGRRMHCPVCATSNENKSTGIRNISYNRFSNNYIVKIVRNQQCIIRRFRALDEAIRSKELLLEHFAKYGYFNIEKLNESYYTREPKPKSSKGKDYSYLIGQKLNGWEIISVDELIKGRSRWRNVQLCDERGRYKELRLNYVLDALKQLPNKKTNIKSNTNIKNIYYHKRKDRYMIQVVRDNMVKKGRAKTLEEAIRIKERILREFETESVAND